MDIKGAIKKLVFNRSVKYKLIVLISICWTIPLLFIGIGIFLYYTNFIVARTNEAVNMNAMFAAEIAVDRLQRLSDTSRLLTYENEVENYYGEYLYNHGVLDEGVIQEKLNREITQMLNNKYVDDNKINFIGVLVELPDNNRVFSIATKKHDYYVNNFIEKDLQEIVIRAQSADRRIGFYANGSRIYLYRNMLTTGSGGYNIEEIGKQFAINIIMVDSDDILSYFKNSDEWGNDMAFAIDSSIGYMSSSQIEQPQRQFLENVLLFNKESEVMSDDYFMVKGLQKTKDVNFSYMVMATNKLITGQIVELVMISLALFLVLGPIMILVTRSIYYNVTNPINMLIKATKEIEQGNLGVIVKNRGSEEFGYLIDSFNSMSLEIKHLVNYVYREEILLKDAKIMNLQSQINPHFLNNTLEIINWKARLSDNMEISKMIEAITTLLDASMNRDGKKFVSLEEEMSFVDSYLYIIKIRFGKRVEIYKEVEEACLEKEVPKLIIQPLIENAVVHGVEGGGGKKIWIRVRDKGVGVGIEIENDGEGISEESLIRIKSILNDRNHESKRLGVKNVDERLRLIYGEDCRLNIERSEQNNTKVSILVPYETKEK